MRISDWSSDVCSSDLAVAPRGVGARLEQRPALALAEPRPEARRGGGIIARPGEQPHRQAVGLDLGLLEHARVAAELLRESAIDPGGVEPRAAAQDRKSTRLNSSH